MTQLRLMLRCHAIAPGAWEEDAPDTSCQLKVDRLNGDSDRTTACEKLIA